MRWLYRLIFLEKFPWLARYLGVSTAEPMVRKQESILYKTELDCLAHFLQGQLQERVYYSVDTKGRVVIGTVEETIAHISLHLKGSPQSMYLAVRLEDEYDKHRAWFQLAFLSFKVRFRKPTLILGKSHQLPSRGR